MASGRRVLSKPHLLLAIMAASMGLAVAWNSAFGAGATISGRWNATITIGTAAVPFQFEVDITGGRAKGWFFNGEQRVLSDAGTYTDDHLVLDFASYARRLDVTLGRTGALDGTYGPTSEASTAHTYRFHAERTSTLHPQTHAEVPSIAGLWLVPAQSRKAGEQAWRLIVKQSGAQVSAALLRVDGDTGALTGVWSEGKLELSHFDGARPSLVEVTPAPGGTLQLIVRGLNGPDQSLTAYRPSDAAAMGLPDAADPSRHTSVQDPSAPFLFSFPDLSGHLVSNTDPRFHGKVLLVDVAGSWCPNCHDEAPFLQGLYRKYHRRGLEVVTLSFEEADQLANPVRLRAFVKDFGLEYPVLLAGTPDELHAKLPQAVGLDAYPTTFFVGRDGRVRSVHAGFAAPATGEFNAKLKQDFSETIERLLAEDPTR